MATVAAILGGLAAVNSVLKALKPGSSAAAVLTELQKQYPNLKGKRAVKIAQIIASGLKGMGYGDSVALDASMLDANLVNDLVDAEQMIQESVMSGGARSRSRARRRRALYLC